MKGAELVGLSYEPPFDYVAVENGHIVIAGDFVSDTSGTGIVHIALHMVKTITELLAQNGISLLNVVDNAGRYVD